MSAEQILFGADAVDYARPEPRREVWMVSGVAPERGHETPTFGPFPTKEAAQKFAATSPHYHVYDDVVNRASLCGSWLF